MLQLFISRIPKAVNTKRALEETVDASVLNVELCFALSLFWDKTELSAENSFEVTKETSHWFLTRSSRPELATNYI